MKRFSLPSFLLFVLVSLVIACAPTPAPRPTVMQQSAPRPRIKITPQDLTAVNKVIESSAVNTDKTATLALLTKSATLLLAPMVKPPTGTLEELQNSTKDIFVGVIKAAKPLPFSGGQTLEAGVYVVSVKNGAINFVNNGGPSKITVKPDFRMIQSRKVEPPEAIITLNKICYSWNQAQVCSEPAIDSYLQQSGVKEQMVSQVKESVTKLGSKLTKPINVNGTITDVEGSAAVEKEQAAMLVAPTVSFSGSKGMSFGNPRARGAWLLPAAADPCQGDTFGAIKVLLPIEQLDNFPAIPAGDYAVRGVQDGNVWSGCFVPAEGNPIQVPAEQVEVLGNEQSEPPQAIIVGIRIWMCFWECRR